LEGNAKVWMLIIMAWVIATVILIEDTEEHVWIMLINVNTYTTQ